MARLLACPFCRELFREDERIETCPECGLGLRPLASLAPNASVDGTADAPLLPVLPAEPPLPWTHWGHGRGPTILLAALGLATFFAPWLELIRPEHRTITGFSLARSAAPWLWAGPVAWFVCIPLLVTRRSVRQLCGVRFITVIFSAMSLIDVGLLRLVPASSGTLVPIAFEWLWGVWASGILSALGVIVASRLGAPHWVTRSTSGASRKCPNPTPEDRSSAHQELPTTDSRAKKTLH